MDPGKCDSYREKLDTINFWRGWAFSSSLRANIGVSIVHRTSCAFFSLLYPADCRLCGEPLFEISRLPVCRTCLSNLQPLSAEFFCVSCRTPFQNAFPLDEEGRCGLCRSGVRGFDSAYCFGAYEGSLRHLIQLFKYEKVQTLAGPLSDLLAAALPRDQRFDAIAPTPLHWRRRWHRGFNQADLLAGRLARRTGIPVMRALRRVHSTETQAGLSNTARRKNVAQAFRVRRGAAIEGKADFAGGRCDDHRFHGRRLRGRAQARGRGQGSVVDDCARGSTDGCLAGAKGGDRRGRERLNAERTIAKAGAGAQRQL